MICSSCDPNKNIYVILLVFSLAESSLFQDSLIKPVTRILVGVALIIFMITLVSRDTPDWLKKLNFSGVNFPPWILACVVIVFTRMRKRTKDFLKKRGWWMDLNWCFCDRVFIHLSVLSRFVQTDVSFVD